MAKQRGRLRKQIKRVGNKFVRQFDNGIMEIHRAVIEEIPLFSCSFSAIKPPAMPVRMKCFSFKKNTSIASMRVATKRTSEQRR